MYTGAEKQPVAVVATGSGIVNEARLENRPVGEVHEPLPDPAALTALKFSGGLKENPNYTVHVRSTDWADTGAAPARGTTAVAASMSPATAVRYTTKRWLLVTVRDIQSARCT